MSLRRFVAIGGVVWLLSLVMIGVRAEPASACSCIGGRTAGDYLSEADAAFVGDVIATRLADPEFADQGNLRLGSLRMIFTFDVTEVRKGDVADRQEVVSWQDEAACGVNFQINRRFVVYARRGASVGGAADALSTSLCDGSSQLGGTPGVAHVAPPVAPSPDGTEPPAESASLPAIGGVALLSVGLSGALVLVARRT